ncbi:hypothetical protein ABLB69_03650 [Xenorhabdus khoisanae]|uniref:hypothetical protein n=1 Tax=Xenorhabdus khoisanae TaxID=880157 RepID=UPI0032B79D9A
MISIKIISYTILFFIMSAFQNASANELTEKITIQDGKNTKTEQYLHPDKLSQNYNLTFENKTGVTIMIPHFSYLGYKDSSCMYNKGEDFGLLPNETASTTLQDSNNFEAGCTSADKYVTWVVYNLYPTQEYKLGRCVFQLKTSMSWFTWYTSVSIVNDYGECSVNLTATCDGRNCLNNPVTSNTSDTPSNIVIEFKL